MWQVILSNRAQKGLNSAEPKIYEKLKQALNTLETNPLPRNEFNLTKISGSKTNFRIRIGDYRILYIIMWNEKEVRIFDIDKKKDSTYK